MVGVAVSPDDVTPEDVTPDEGVLGVQEMTGQARSPPEGVDWTESSPFPPLRFNLLGEMICRS